MTSLTSQTALAQFLKAKADFLTVVRAAEAVEGFINGQELEDELVSREMFSLLCLVANYV